MEQCRHTSERTWPCSTSCMRALKVSQRRARAPRRSLLSFIARLVPASSAAVPAMAVWQSSHSRGMPARVLGRSPAHAAPMRRHKAYLRRYIRAQRSEALSGEVQRRCQSIVGREAAEPHSAEPTSLSTPSKMQTNRAPCLPWSTRRCCPCVCPRETLRVCSAWHSKPCRKE